MALPEPPILLVEDDSRDIELALAAFKTCPLPCPLQIVRDGVEALRHLADCEKQRKLGAGVLPRLILLDLNLPKVSGREVLTKIKSSPVTKFIPVVVLTSSISGYDLLNSYLDGANSYLQKPVRFDEFCGIVKAAVNYWLTVNLEPLAALLPPEEE